MKNFWISINPFNNEFVENRWLYLVKTVLKFATIYLLNIFIIALLLLVIHLILGYDIFYGDFIKTQTLETIIYYAHCISIVLTLLFVKFVDKEKAVNLGFTKSWWQFGLGILYGVCAVAVILAILLIFGQYKFEGLNPNRKWGSVFCSLGAFVVYALSEEMLCRGLIENRLRKRFNVTVCVFVAYFAFCTPHLFELFTFSFWYCIVALLNILLISYSFSLFLDRYDNIYVCSGFHATWNVLFYSFLGANVNGVKTDNSIFSFSVKNSIFNGGQYGTEYGLVSALVLLNMCIILTVLVKRKEKKERELKLEKTLL